jgi:hypothetical protein
MRRSTATRLYAAGRIAYAVGLLGAPGRVGSSWIEVDARRPAAQVGLRGLGARDLALSVGILAFADDADRLRPWLWATAGSDCADVAATLVAGEALSVRARAGAALVAGSAALAGFVLALDHQN